GIAYFWPTMLGVTAERFPKGGALLLCLLGSVGNLSIAQVLPAMGSIYDHYAVQKLTEVDPTLASQVVDKDKNVIEPDLVQKLPKDSPGLQVIAQAEAVGAAMAFRWVSILPCVLVVIFGAIAIKDRMSGGYQAVHLTGAADKKKELAGEYLAG